MVEIGCSPELNKQVRDFGVKSLLKEDCEVCIYGDTGTVLCKVYVSRFERFNGNIEIAKPITAVVLESGKPVTFEILFLNFPEYRIVGVVNRKSQIQMILDKELMFKHDKFSLDTLKIFNEF